MPGKNFGLHFSIPAKAPAIQEAFHLLSPHLAFKSAGVKKEFPAKHVTNWEVAFMALEKLADQSPVGFWNSTKAEIDGGAHHVHLTYCRN